MGFNSWINNLRIFENLFFLIKYTFLSTIYENFKPESIHPN